MQLVQTNGDIIKTIVEGKMMHETLLYRTFKVKNVSAFHTMLLKMIIENEHGVWPQTEHSTSAVYLILRYNVSMKMDDIESNAPPGDMMWYKRYKYTHLRYFRR